MEVHQAINQRRSIRNFNSKPISEETLRGLINDATMAPSSMNRQPWSFFVIQDAALLAEINRRAKAYLLKIATETARYSGYKDRFSSEDFDIFYGGQTLLGICTKDDLPNGREDCHLAAQNVMLSAWEQDIGSCFLGFIRTYMESAEAQVWLQIPDGYTVVAPLVLGYFDKVPDAAQRLAAEVLFWR